MKTRYLITTALITLILALGNVAAAEGLTLTPPIDSQKYKPLTAVSTTVYVVPSKDTYMACKVDMNIDDISNAYLFINQSYAFNDKFESKNLTKGIKISKDFIINGYIVFNMKDYKGVVENTYPNKVVIGIEKADGSIVFSNTVLLTIATGDLSCEKEISGEKITYKIKEGFLPIDPSTISVKANGIELPYSYNDYDKSVTALLAPAAGESTLNVEFKVKDLRGQGVIINDTCKLESVMESAQDEFTRVQLAKYIYDISGFEPAKKVSNFSDLDYIPYDARLVVSTLKEHDIMMENKVGDKYTFDSNSKVTQQMLADAINKLVGRSFYKPTDPSAYVTVNEAISVLLKSLVN